MACHRVRDAPTLRNATLRNAALRNAGVSEKRTFHPAAFGSPRTARRECAPLDGVSGLRRLPWQRGQSFQARPGQARNAFQQLRGVGVVSVSE
jgi:hypothetical protein